MFESPGLYEIHLFLSIFSKWSLELGPCACGINSRCTLIIEALDSKTNSKSDFSASVLSDYIVLYISKYYEPGTGPVARPYFFNLILAPDFFFLLPFSIRGIFFQFSVSALNCHPWEGHSKQPFLGVPSTSTSPPKWMQHALTTCTFPSDPRKTAKFSPEKHKKTRI